MRYSLIILVLLSVSFLGAEGTLFVGLEGSTPATYTSDMEGFPNNNWNSYFSQDVSGAAATPDGIIYLCEGAFTTHLYEASLTNSPVQLCTIAHDMSALAWGRDMLWGYSNYASPLGIYSINISTGATELVLATGSFRFFALDYNPIDDLFYGYTEYGVSGLYSIDIDSGVMTLLTGSIPATNGQGRGMAVGDNTVFLTATRGDAGIPYFAYDISQGAGGEWVEFPNPYPNHHSTGGAAFVAAPDESVIISGTVTGSDFPETGIADCTVSLLSQFGYETVTDEDGFFIFPEVFHNVTYVLEIVKPGYTSYVVPMIVETDDIDLGTIILSESAFPVENVVAEETIPLEQVTLNWDIPEVDNRNFENYIVYRFLESFSGNPEVWETLAYDLQEPQYIDNGWADLESAAWQYAVVAQYTNGIFSEAVLSNALLKNEVAYPAENVIAAETPSMVEVMLSWDAPQYDNRVLENYAAYRFLEEFAGNPETWYLLADDLEETIYVDHEWAELTSAFWQYAVIAQYTNGINAEAAFSNTIEKINVDVSQETIISGSGIKDIYPNPCNPSATISYQLSEAGYAKIDIYNLKGQRVNSLVSNHQTAGDHQITWNGDDEYNNCQPSGIYLLRFYSDGYLLNSKKLLLLK